MNDNFDQLVSERSVELDRQLRRCLKQINSQIEEIRQEAVRTSTAPVAMRDSAGDYIWAPLVVAKANILYSLVLMDQKSNGEEAEMTATTLEERRAAAPEHIDNASLPAKSPMYYYCKSCGHLTAVKDEGWYLDPPPKFCDWCVKHGHAVEATA